MKPREDIDSILEEQKYWRRITEILGWEIHGWTFTHLACFNTPHNGHIELTGSQRDSIVKAFEVRT